MSSDFSHLQLVLDTLRRPGAFAGMAAEPVDFEIVPNLSGEPDRMQAWLIFATATQARAAQEQAETITARTSALLREGGFPPHGIQSLVVYLTSLEQIEEHGGRFAFFR